MTEWPDDWFRETPAASPGVPRWSPRGAGGRQPDRVLTPSRVRPGRVGAEPTVQLPYRSGAGGRRRAVPADPAGLAGPAAWRPGSPRHAAASPRGPWPTRAGRRLAAERAAIQAATASRGWRRWLRPKRIAAIIAVLLSVAIVGSVITLLLPGFQDHQEEHPGRLLQQAGPGRGHELADHRLGQQAGPDPQAGAQARDRARHQRQAVRHDPGAAPAVQRRPAGADQPSPRLLRADPRPRV